MRVVGDGRHFRGYVNTKLVAHGHDSELPAGPVGLYIKGTGTAVISDLIVTSLRKETKKAKDDQNH